MHVRILELILKRLILNFQEIFWYITVSTVNVLPEKRCFYYNNEKVMII